MTQRFQSFFRPWWRLALGFVVSVLLVGALAPFINAAAFSGRIERALEASLGRRVTFSAAHFTLLTGPGFSLDNVSIQEDPKYGLEPFAHVPQLEVRLRLDKLLLGHIAVANLRLLQPSLNLVQRSDGSWNVVELIDRLSPPNRLSISVFPAVEVSEGRIDFKSGMRKTTLYVANSDLSIYPERSGKLYVRFSGSPARTDRAGNGFGHLRGAVNWYLKPATKESNQLEADVTLDPSNLSELTTLFEGEDAGVHGTVSSHIRIEGPVTALRLAGDVSLADVHRWDLMPSSGENWRIRYAGKIDLLAHQLVLNTIPAVPGQPTPVSVQLRVNDFLKHPAWSFLTTFSKAPAAELLPVSRRMGIVFPDGLNLEGTVDGVVGYSNANAFSGAVSISGVVASFPNLPPIRSDLMSARISPDRIYLEPTTVETGGNGTLQVSGDYGLADHGARVSFSPVNFPVKQLRNTLEAWFDSAPALGAFRDGLVTGKIVNGKGSLDEPAWSGQLRFSDSKLVLPGIAVPLTAAEGRVEFDKTSLDLDRFSASLGGRSVAATYHYSADSNSPQRLHIDMPEADLTDLESALEPALRAQSFFARLGVTRRSIPAWLATRNLRGDLIIHRFSINGVPFGALRSHMNWQGTSIVFSGFELTLPTGAIEARGRVNVAASSPHYQFTGTVTGFPWKGGVLDAQGQFQTDGVGTDALQNLQVDGMFAGQNVNLGPDDLFEKVSGGFHFSFENGWTSLRLANLQASEGNEDWTGEAASQSDGKLIFDLENAGRQRHVVSTLEPQSSGESSDLNGQAALR
jgi:AsmA family